MQPSQPPSDITRVSRSKTDARQWYDFLSRWYDLAVDPFEGAARTVGIDLLDVSAGETVLDVGCGTGSALVDFARGADPDGTVVGIDISRGMCRTAKSSLEAVEQVDRGVVEGDGSSLPFRDDTFDAVFASFVLDLFDTPEIPTVLKEWARVMVPGGRLCVVSLTRRTNGPIVWLYERVHERLPRYVDCRPIYVGDTLRDVGFTLVRSRTTSAWGIPVDAVLARVSESGSLEPAI